VGETIVPAAQLAIMVQAEPHAEIDRVCGLLVAHVTEHALAVEGPIREYCLVDRDDTPDSSAWRTEVGWPIFSTGM
jgi:hypothetical protein